MKKRIAALFFAAALTAVLGTGCHMKSASEGKASQPDYPVTVNGVDFKQAPTRVAVLSPSLAEIVTDMGYGGSLCGRSQECDAPSSVAALPEAGNMQIPVMKVLEGWNPDLVLLQAEPSDSVKSQLEADKIPYVVVPAASTFDGLKDTYTAIGRIFFGESSGTENGNQQMNLLTDSLDAVTQKVSTQATEKPLKAVYITDAFGHAATGDTVLSRLITAAGLTNAAESASNWTATDEQLASADVIFCPDSLTTKLKASLSKLPAVQNGRIYGISAAAMERQSLRMAAAAESMAKAVYPEAFTGESSAVSVTASAENMVTSK